MAFRIIVALGIAVMAWPAAARAQPAPHPSLTAVPFRPAVDLPARRGGSGLPWFLRQGDAGPFFPFSTGGGRLAGWPTHACRFSPARGMDCLCRTAPSAPGCCARFWIESRQTEEEDER
jgi:hypothetical protein